MNNGPRIFKKSALAIGITAMLGGVCTPAVAVNWEEGDWSISFDSSFSLGTSYRIEDRDWALIGNSNDPRFNWTGYNGNTNVVYPSADIWAQSRGAYSTNNDNGDLNFDPGKSFSTLFKGTHDLDVRYKNMGFFARGMYFYDFEMMDGDRAWRNPVSASNYSQLDKPFDPCKDKYAKEELCADVRLLDAFFYADFDLGDMPVSIRIGDQVVSWGESTFIQHGINTTNPVDVTRAQAPGAELKEVFIPVGMVYAQLGLTDSLGLTVYYQYEWEKSRLPQNGSYFATNDFAGEGGQDANIQLGFTGNPDIDLDFLMLKLNELRGMLQSGANPTMVTQLYMGYPTKVAVRAYSDEAHKDADDQGQYGIRLSYYSEALNDTEFGFYHINYHSQRPLISGIASDFTAAGLASDLAYLATNEITRDNITDLRAFTKAEFGYPEDIKLYGLSFNTNVGETALAGEVAYRQDEPLQIDDVELLYAGMPQQLAAMGVPDPLARPDLAGISQLDNYLGYTVGPGETATGYVLSDTVQAQFTATHLFGPTLGTDNLILLGEVGYVKINDMPDPSLLRLNGPGTSRSGPIPGKEGLHTGISNGPETNPFPTDDAWGYRLLAKADFNNVYAGINMSVRATFAHDVDGITPDPLFLFIEDRKSSSLSLDFDYLSKWSASVSLNSFWGGVGSTNALSDRDFVSFNIKYSI
ncbi:DUF1302 domain-containing protein [Bowmanella pacifica]|uniref:DUF1302 domain-containing protein n=1 Tax=Bowmanella pacifica TaxID=502051 RepID=A0A918DIY6_9ALTE|nr:DUF1302 domain-containing protein [Bowmanella pacifica]GGO69480.1 hypothetical protein GCM10010982_20740 [Bowmanella pacifica]